MSRKQKHKYDRRRAVDCKILKKSDTHKGYCKYMITICEKDGTCHKQPAYGKDMQDALSRVIKQEITMKVENKIETSTWLVFLALVAVFALPLMLAGASSPWFLAYAFGSVGLIFVIASLWYAHVKRGEEKW